MRLFTKSAFKEALLCPARLNYYHNDDYANQAITDDFLKALANGGFQVEELAKIYHDVPVENDLKNESGHNDTSARTDELMLQENVVMAEATFKWKNCSIRADIIKKTGNTITLLEIKAKSRDGEKDKWQTAKGGIVSEKRPYVYDVAFQKYVITNYLKERFPDKTFTVKAALLMADKGQIADVDHLNQFFKIIERGGKTEIQKQPGWETLKNTEPANQILTPFFDVDELCDAIIAGTSPEQNVYLRGLSFKKFIDVMSERYVNKAKSFDHCHVSTECFKCPYFATSDENKKDGYDECWRELTKDFPQPYHNYTEKPLLENLWGGVNTKTKGKILKEQKKIFLDQLTHNDLPVSGNNNQGLHYNERKRIQVALETNNLDFADDLANKISDGVYLDVEGLRTEMSSWKFPLHMIDFETSTTALPFYVGMSPYEQVAFQFSHHIIEKDESGKYTVAHKSQWINASSEFPNFEFVRQLKKAVGNEGSIFRYATHENTILRAIRVQLEQQKPSDYLELIGFIDSITRPKNGDSAQTGIPERDMIDLCEIVKRYYYDPIMGGSNSIKAVLPAVLKSDFLFNKYSKPIYGNIIPSLNFSSDNPKIWIEEKGDNPYKHLPEIASFFPVDSQDIVRRTEEFTEEDDFGDSQINNGGAALWAYGLLQFKLQQPTERDALVKALLQYCELDTLSMVFIWEYFNSKVGICGSKYENDDKMKVSLEKKESVHATDNQKMSQDSELINTNNKENDMTTTKHTDFAQLYSLWTTYNNAKRGMVAAIGRTDNIVGEYAEMLVGKLYDAQQATASQKGYDLMDDNGDRIQVKARVVDSSTTTTNLSDIHNWEFDYLVVVFFDSKTDEIACAKKFSKTDVREAAKVREGRNVVTTSKKFMEKGIDITAELTAVMKPGVRCEDFPSGEKTGNVTAENIPKTDIVTLGKTELEFEPADKKEFKRLLIQKKQAKRTYYYKDGTKKTDVWNAPRFDEGSDLMLNIKTAPYWKNRKERGLVKVKFEIEQEETPRKFEKISNGMQPPTGTVFSGETELEFVPADEKEFKRLLIQKKQAKRTYYYKDGTKKTDDWDASSFKEDSSLRGNIKSTQFWRKREKLGIIKVKFEIT